MPTEVDPPEMKIHESPTSQAGLQRLDPKAKTLWRISHLLMELISVAVIVVLLATSTLSSVPQPLLIAGLVVYAIVLVGGVIVLPDLRWRRWGYEIRTDEVHLQHGYFWRTRTVVPLRRVQHIELKQGPLEGLFGLSTVTFYTAAEEHEIPALTNQEAHAVRDRIAALTRTLDDI